MNVDIIEKNKKEKKPKDLTDEERKSEVEVEVKKKEIKAYVRDLKILVSNIKKIYSLVFWKLH